MAVGHDDTADVVQKETGHDTVIPRNHDRLVEKLRLAVKQYGKEAATYRFTSEEKDALAAAVFATRIVDSTAPRMNVAVVPLWD